MQSPAFNKKYAKSIPELKSRFYFVENIPADLLDLLRENNTFDFGSGTSLVLDYAVLEGSAFCATGWL